jgi:hypothetical protein
MKNMTKGKVKMPWAVANVAGDKQWGFALMTTEFKKSILNINKNQIDDIDNYIERGVKFFEKRNMVLPEWVLEKRKSGFNLAQKIELSEDLEMLANPHTEKIKGNAFRKIYHEMGHLQHQYSCKNYKYLGKHEECMKWFGKVSEQTKEFLETPTIQTTAGKISTYAQESPSEFVAETYSHLAAGRKLDDEVVALYKKYNGPNLF